MPTITLHDGTRFDVEENKRLVLALEDSGIDILHRCGGYAMCTTCRVKVLEGEPQRMTRAELEKLQQQGNLGNFRLSCQIPTDHDMTVEVLMRVSTTEMDDAGKRPQDEITPEVEWVDKPDSSDD